MKPLAAPAALAVFLVTASATDLLALDIPRPIDGPVTITENGSYVVTQGFSVAVPPAITIAAPNVTIDLNGKTITTPVIDPALDNSPLVLMDLGSQQLLIRNGKLEGGSHCIYGVMPPALRLSMDHVDCNQAKYGINLRNATAIAITDSVLTIRRVAVDIDGSYPLTFERNRVTTRYYYTGGIILHGVSSGSFSWNTVDVESYQGLVLQMTSNGSVRITNNVIHGANTPGGLNLLCDHSLVANNTIDGSRLEAINVRGSGNLIVNNRLNHGSVVCTGIYVGGSDNTVSGNVVTDYHWGMRVGGSRNTISGNSLMANWDGGISIDGDDNKILGNSAQSTFSYDSLGLSLSGSRNVYKANDLRGNGRPGDGEPPWLYDLIDEGQDNVDAGGNLIDQYPAPDPD